MRHWPHLDVARRWSRFTGRWLRALPIWRWMRDHQVLTMIIAVLSLLVTAVGVAHDMIPDFAGGAAPPMVSPPQSRSTVTWPAVIVKTWSDERQAYVGTFSRRSPDVTAPKAHSYQEHDRISVSCGISDGGPAETTVHGQRDESNVWYLTSEKDWLPRVFVELLDHDHSPRQCRTDERTG